MGPTLHRMTTDVHEVLMLGTDYERYGDLTVSGVGELVVAMSVGATPDTPSAQFKGDAKNEDALSARDSGSLARLVVADSHYGDQASGLLVAAMHAAALEQVTPDLGVLPGTTDGSETTLTTVWINRDVCAAEARWVGDSLALLLRPGAPPIELIDADHQFFDTESFSWSAMHHRSVPVEPGDVIIAFTDGVNECHYRQPATSISIERIGELFEQATSLTGFVEALGELALIGVNGHPGGQDNIAIAAITI